MQQIPIKYERHIFVCIKERLEPMPSCGGKGSQDIITALRTYLNQNGLVNRFNVTKSQCLGHCNEGPTIAVYPEGKIFKQVTIDDVPKIIQEFLS